MYHPTRQAQQAIDAMRAAGFKRTEFSARTERNSKGEYGNVIVTVWNLNQAIERSQAMVEQGLSIIHYVKDGQIKSVEISDVGYLPDNQIEIVNI